MINVHELDRTQNNFCQSPYVTWNIALFCLKKVKQLSKSYWSCSASPDQQRDYPEMLITVFHKQSGLAGDIQWSLTAYHFSTRYYNTSELQKYSAKIQRLSYLTWPWLLKMVVFALHHNCVKMVWFFTFLFWILIQIYIYLYF